MSQSVCDGLVNQSVCHQLVRDLVSHSLISQIVISNDHRSVRVRVRVTHNSFVIPSL